MTDWGVWGPCLDSDGQEIDCGEGTKTRYREIITQAENGGVACGELTDSQPCDLDPCWNPTGPICITGSPEEQFNGTYVWSSWATSTQRNRWELSTDSSVTLYFSACVPGARCRWEIRKNSQPDYGLTVGAANGQSQWPWDSEWQGEITLTPNTSC